MRRKKKNQSHKNRVLFQIFLMPELAARLKARAAEESLPMCAWVRQQIVFGLDKPSRRALDLPSHREARQEAPAS
jgi:hypothetical protein